LHSPRVFYSDKRCIRRSFAKAFALDSSYVHAYHLSGLCFYSMGDQAMAISAFMGGLNGAQQHQKGGKTDPKMQNVPALFHMLGVSFQALGLYPRAMEHFKQVPRSLPTGVVLEPAVVDAKHSSWYNRELAFFYWTKLDEPISSWELDEEISEIIKEGWSKRKDYKEVSASASEPLQKAGRGKAKRNEEQPRKLRIIWLEALTMPTQWHCHHSTTTPNI
jgi:hypothetical protein